jgi:hypothetical protein
VTPLPAHRARSHGEIRDRLFRAARRWFPDYLGPGGWDPSDTGSGADPAADDLGRGLLDAYALALHVLWTYQEAWGDEGFLTLARLDASIHRLTAQIGYRPAPGVAAVGIQHFRCVAGVSGVLPAGFQVGSGALGDEAAAIYETLEPIRLDPAVNEIRAWIGPGAGAGQGGPGSEGEADGGGEPGSAGGTAAAAVLRTEPLADALKDRLAAGAGGDLAARDAARARVRMRQLTDLMKKLKEAGVDQCQSTKEELCKQLCEAQQQAAAEAQKPGPMSESQRIAFRQLAKLAERQQGAMDALEKALARCRDEPDEAYRRRLDAMSQFLDAFVAGLIQDSRDQVALLRGARGLAQLDRAYGGDSPSPLGQAMPGTDTLYLVALADGRIVPGTFPAVAPGDWFVLAEDLERLDDAGRVSRERRYREAVRVVAVNHERVAGFRPRFTRITFEPRLTRRYRLDRTVLLGNCGLVSEGARVEEAAALSLDGRTLELAERPLTWLADPAAAGGRRPECRAWVNGEEWVRTDSLLDAGPADRRYAVEAMPEGGARVRFGDGENGAVVPFEAELRLRYRVGLGLAGNRAALRVDQLLGAHPAVERTFNPLPLAGGSPAEGRDSVALRAPAALRAMDRAVSLADVEALAQSFDGVQRARVRRGARRFEVQVLVSGVGGLPLADIEGLARFLRARVAPGIAVSVRNARPVPVYADILLRLVRGADPLAVVAAVRLRLGVDGRPGTPPGLLHPDRTDLDQDLGLSQVYAALEGIEGLSSCLVRALYRPSADAAGNLLRLDRRERTLRENIAAAADERLLWAPPRDGEDGVNLSFETERDL